LREIDGGIEDGSGTSSECMEWYLSIAAHGGMIEDKGLRDKYLRNVFLIVDVIGVCISSGSLWICASAVGRPFRKDFADAVKFWKAISNLCPVRRLVYVYKIFAVTYNTILIPNIRIDTYRTGLFLFRQH